MSSICLLLGKDEYDLVYFLSSVSLYIGDRETDKCIKDYKYEKCYNRVCVWWGGRVRGEGDLLKKGNKLYEDTKVNKE